MTKTPPDGTPPDGTPPDKFVVDVNTLINALINSESKAANILLQKTVEIRLFSCHFLYIELLKHKDKVLKLSGLLEEDFLDLLYSLLSNIEFINESYIPFHCWQQANQLLQEIDPKDIPYLALTIHTGSILWTGDKIMTNGLLSKGFDKIINTSTLYDYLFSS